MRRLSFPKRSWTARLISSAAWMALAFAPIPEAVAEDAFDLVQSQTRQLLGLDVIRTTSEEEGARATKRVAELLSKPLTASSVAQVALYQNATLQKIYDQLGASLVEQSRPEKLAAAGEDAPPDPADSAGERDVEALHAQIGEAKLRVQAYQAVDSTLAVAASAERAFYRAIAARQIFELVGRLQSSTSITAELRQMQTATGAATALMAKEADVFDAELRIELAGARHEMEISRLELVRALGLTPAADISLPDELPKFPEALTTPSVSAAAVRRPDLMVLRWQTSVEEWSQQLAGVEQSDKKGADALANREAEIFSAIQQAYAGYRATYEVALVNENTIVPLSRGITEERLLQYNGMLIDVTDLLAAARDGLRREISALVAKRDFFLAKTNFQAAVVGGTQSNGSSKIPARTETGPESSGNH